MLRCSIVTNVSQYIISLISQYVSKFSPSPYQAATFNLSAESKSVWWKCGLSSSQLNRIQGYDLRLIFFSYHSALSLVFFHATLGVSFLPCANDITLRSHGNISVGFFQDYLIAINMLFQRMFCLILICLTVL